MALPIVYSELVLTLRQRKTFLLVGLSYAFLSLSIAFFWGTAHGVLEWREQIARPFLYWMLFFAFAGLSQHTISNASRSLAGERERETDVFLRTAPVSPVWLLLQKGISPLVSQWLFLLGALPFLSLTVLLGGVSYAELAYQLTNLCVWIVTCIAAGLWSAARVKESRKGARDAYGILFIVGFLVPLFFLLTAGLKNALGGYDLEEGQRVLLRQTLGGLGSCLGALSVLSPFWMAATWFDLQSFAPRLPHIPLLTTFPSCPALVSWIGNLLLQITLLALAVRRWGRPVPDKNAKRSMHPRTSAPMEPFPEGWKTFYEQEARFLFAKKSNERITLALGGIVALILPLVAFPFVVPLAMAITLVVLWICFGLAAAAFRREREKNTAFFLIGSPSESRDVFLGKWLYFLSLALKVILVGWLCILPGFLVGVFVRGVSWGEAVDISLTFIWPLAFLHMLCFAGVVAGLYKYPRAWFLYVFFLFYCLGIVLVPVLLYRACKILLCKPTRRERAGETQRQVRIRKLSGILMVVIVALNIFLLGLQAWSGQVPDWLLSEEVLIVVLIVANMVVLPLCLTVSGWVWVSRRPDVWWRKRLLDSRK